MFQYLYSLGLFVKVSGEIKVRREIVLTRYFNRVAKQRNFRKKRSYLGHTIKLFATGTFSFERDMYRGIKVASVRISSKQLYRVTHVCVCIY